MTTIHNGASKQDIAKTVLICGDPLRAKKFALDYLEKPKLVNEVRGMLAYTGKSKMTGQLLTIMGHGMGLCSIGLYVHELYTHYDVDTIIRFGSAGAYDENLKVGKVLICDQSWTESNYGKAYGTKKKTLSAHPKLISIAKELSKEDSDFFHGKVHASMWFYRPAFVKAPNWFVKKGIHAVEMESYALYAIANFLKKQAMTLVTISDNIVTGEAMSADERMTTFNKMFEFVMKLAKQNEE